MGVFTTDRKVEGQALTLIPLTDEKLKEYLGKALMKYVTTLPQVAVTREQYRELLRAKR